MNAQRGAAELTQVWPEDYYTSTDAEALRGVLNAEPVLSARPAEPHGAPLVRPYVRRYLGCC
ncbi:MAG: hypothetical protein ACRDQ7_07900 [Haloechinothrix sp.]